MSSLREVAQRAGVSLATASRVASGGSPVRPETRERVERAMRELLYVLPGRQPATGLIGVLVPELANPIFPSLAQAIETRAAPEGFASILCNTTGAAFREVDYVHMLLDRRVDGMIFISSEITNLHGEHGHYKRLLAEGARIVFVNGALPTLDIPSVGVDEHAAGELATQHLIDLGHERIGFVAGPEHYLPTRFKAAGRLAALRSADLGGHGLVAHADFAVEGGRQALRELLERPERPTAVVCSSDVMALGVLQEAARQGVRVPDAAVRCRLRRDRCGHLDVSAADDGRATDRGDRPDGGRRPPVADPRTGQATAELPVPAAAPRASFHSTTRRHATEAPLTVHCRRRRQRLRALVPAFSSRMSKGGQRPLMRRRELRGCPRRHTGWWHFRDRGELPVRALGSQQPVEACDRRHDPPPPGERGIIRRPR